MALIDWPTNFGERLAGISELKSELEIALMNARHAISQNLQGVADRAQALRDSLSGNEESLRLVTDVLKYVAMSSQAFRDLDRKFMESYSTDAVPGIPKSWKPSAQSIRDLLLTVDSGSTPQIRGSALEEIVARLFNSLPNFYVVSTRAHTVDEEIDIEVMHTSSHPIWRHESALMFVECKNKTSKCGKSDIVIFNQKIENRSNRVRVGFLASWHGFTKSLNPEMVRTSGTAALIVPLDRADLLRPIKGERIDGNEFLSVITSKWHWAVNR